MMSSTHPDAPPATGVRVRHALVAALIFVVALRVGPVWTALGLRDVLPGLLGSLVRNAIVVAIVVLGTAVMHRAGPRTLARELGFATPIGRGFAFALLASAPMLVAFAVSSAVASPLDLRALVLGSVVAPFVEELLFRAFLFRQLLRRARLGFWPAALIPSVLFAAGHIYQSGELSQQLGIVAITGAGGLMFCWMFMRWGDSIWPVFGLHALMNLWWHLFAIDTTALGGWIANGARLATVVVAIALTLQRGRTTSDRAARR